MGMGIAMGMDIHTHTHTHRYPHSQPTVRGHTHADAYAPTEGSQTVLTIWDPWHGNPGYEVNLPILDALCLTFYSFSAPLF